MRRLCDSCKMAGCYVALLVLMLGSSLRPSAAESRDARNLNGELDDVQMQVRATLMLKASDVRKLSNSLCEHSDVVPLKKVQGAGGDSETLPEDCLQLKKRGSDQSGVYKIFPGGKELEVYCDMETDGGGWIVFQRRGDYGMPPRDFFLGWDEYKKGFGELTKEFWLGNEHLSLVTRRSKVELRIDLQDFEGERRFAAYREFTVKSETESYRATFGSFSGNAGDSMTQHANNSYFSTKDRDNDRTELFHCARDFAAGWWFGSCTSANLNGRYLRGPYVSDLAIGVSWFSWKGPFYSLKFVEMKIRPAE